MIALLAAAGQSQQQVIDTQARNSRLFKMRNGWKWHEMALNQGIVTRNGPKNGFRSA